LIWEIENLRDEPWRNPRWHPLKLEASSPFREGDNSPSFSVNLDPSSDKYGWWNDSGATDRRWRAGPPEKLIAFLRDITEEEARELIYGTNDETTGDYITIRLPTTSARKKYKSLNISLLDSYKDYENDYLLNRGISPEVQALFQTGYDPVSRAITLPWINGAGQLMNVKYRSTLDKRFWYAKGGAPIRDLIYGIDIVYKRNIKRIAIVEAEIDCLTLWSAGMPAIATGGAAFNDRKRDLILRSPIEEIIIVRDNDKAGRSWRNQVQDALRVRIDVSLALVPRDYKDVNEARHQGLTKPRRLQSLFPSLREKANYSS